MIALFQAAKSTPPVARAIHKFNQSATAKWVPVNKSFITLIKIVLRAAVERLELAHMAITLRCVTHQGYRHLLLVSDVHDLPVSGAGGIEDFFISTQEVNHSPFENFVAEAALSLALNFSPPQGQPQRLGYLVAQVEPGADVKSEGLTKELALVAEEIMRIIGRYQTRYRAIHVYGDQSYWIGNSNALRQLDQRIDQLAKGNRPVLIRADKGCGKVIAARSLHCLSRTDTAPFVESDCKEWEEGVAESILQSLHAYANGGTLFLRNIDALSTAAFQVLRNFWVKTVGLQFDGTYNVRLIMSCSHTKALLGPMQAQWLAQYAQELALPTLRERHNDLRDLAQFFMREYSLNAGFDLTDDAWQLLESSQPFADVDQLKVAIQKLALIANGELATEEELRAVLN